MNDNPDMPAGEALNPRARATDPWGEERATALLMLADGTIIEGKGAGAVGIAVGEVCFNTAMTGYQEILTDPSYAGQIITFTFPHIGNVGTNTEDIETASLAAASGVRGCVLRAPITRASNYRAAQEFDDWLKARGIIAITGVDTRALTALIREKGMPNAVIAHAPDGTFDLVFGYFNRNWTEEIAIPAGPNNRIEPNGPDAGAADDLAEERTVGEMSGPAEPAAGAADSAPVSVSSAADHAVEERDDTEAGEAEDRPDPAPVTNGHVDAAESGSTPSNGAARSDAAAVAARGEADPR